MVSWHSVIVTCQGNYYYRQVRISPNHATMETLFQICKHEIRIFPCLTLVANVVTIESSHWCRRLVTICQKFLQLATILLSYNSMIYNSGEHVEICAKIKTFGESNIFFRTVTRDGKVIHCLRSRQKKPQKGSNPKAPDYTSSVYPSISPNRNTMLWNHSEHNNFLCVQKC